MNPEHRKLASEECSQLLSQGLIESTKSPWACEAFYVNKRSEQKRGKLRLVINYQPLNHFLQDDKFPLPDTKSLFSNLHGARYFSKFDLKAGFWQLGIHPDDRYKTAFCIPDHHYQWTVMPFGLKVAPSLFQKAMTKIFEPIMHSALVYIDDILLYSKDEQSHALLLKQFADIVKDKGIMLSESKMQIFKREIDFLGMIFKDGSYTPGKHIAEELTKFPDSQLTKKQIQQFLGIIQYIRNFIPHIARMTRPLQLMLRKDAGPWTEKQTEAVKRLKQVTRNLPALAIPSTGKRILQTDASDEFWGAMLFEEKDGQKQLCGYKSGQFKQSELHYHSTFKEILAVKYGIHKFEFHLAAYHFKVIMDCSSFPKMLQFKQKMLPHPQLLRWAEWFSKYSFTVEHIKGAKNLIPDMLSRPPRPPDKQSAILPFILMASSSSSDPHTDFPIEDLPLGVREKILNNTLNAQARDNLYSLQDHLVGQYDISSLAFQHLGIHHKYPFIHLYEFVPSGQFPIALLHMLWYFCHMYHIAIIIPTDFFCKALHGNSLTMNAGPSFKIFFKWFKTQEQWKKLLSQEVAKVLSTQQVTKEFIKTRTVESRTYSQECHQMFTTLIFHRPFKASADGLIISFPQVEVYSTKTYSLRDKFVEYSQEFRAFQRHMFEKNKIFPEELWPSGRDPEDELPWDFYDSSYAVHLYHLQTGQKLHQKDNEDPCQPEGNSMSPDQEPINKG